MFSRFRLLSLGAGLALIGLAVLAISAPFATTAVGSQALTIVSIDAMCGDGGVVGSVTVQNNTDAAISDTLPFMLMQHIPPSLGGEAQFTPVSGGGFTVDVTLAAGEEATFDFGPISIANVSPDANSLRVDTNVSLRPDLNPEKSDSFGPCGPAATPTSTNTPAPTSTNTPEAATETPEATETPQAATETPAASTSTPTNTPSGGAAPVVASATPVVQVASAAGVPSGQVVGVAGVQALPATGEGGTGFQSRWALLGAALVVAGTVLAGAGYLAGRRRLQ